MIDFVFFRYLRKAVFQILGGSVRYGF